MIMTAPSARTRMDRRIPYDGEDPAASVVAAWRAPMFYLSVVAAAVLLLAVGVVLVLRFAMPTRI